MRACTGNSEHVEAQHGVEAQLAGHDHGQRHGSFAESIRKAIRAEGNTGL